jgi:hypothetical protein
MNAQCQAMPDPRPELRALAGSVDEDVAVKGRPDKRGQRTRVDAARKQAAAALGRDPEAVAPRGTARYVPAEPPQQRQPTPREALAVLSLGEAAVRIGVSRRELAAMIAAGKIEALPTGFTQMILTREVERLSQSS